MKVTKRKDGRYQIQIQFNGKVKYFIGKNKNEVEANAIEYINLHNKGLDISKENITIKKLSKEWFDLYQKNNAESTKKRVNGILDTYIIPYLGDIPLKNLKSHHIQQMLNDIQESHTDTTRKAFQIIKSILDFATLNDYCYKNVAKPCIIKRVPSKERTILSTNDIKKLEKSSSKYADFFVFLLYTGLRRGEIAGLKWSDIDFKNKEIHVRHSMSFVTNQGSLKSTKTNKVRNIPILNKTAEILKRRKNTSNSIYVFSQPDGTNLTESSIKRMHESFEKATGLKFGLHELRHTFCTILFYAGVSAVNASKIMGHSIVVMQEIYTHLDKDRAKLEIDRLNEYLK